VLSGSERLNEADLVANAKSKSQRHLAAIAVRKTLSEAVTDVLGVARRRAAAIRSRAQSRPCDRSACVCFCDSRRPWRQPVPGRKHAAQIATKL